MRSGAQETARPDTSGWKCEQCPFTQGYQGNSELGATYVGDDAARLGDATGYDEKGAYVHAAGAGRYANGANDTRWELADLGLDSRAAQIEGGRPGTYRYRLDYDELPYRRFDTTATPFRRSGDDALVLPAGWVYAGTTAGFTTLDTSLADRDIGSDRRSLRIGGEFHGSDALKFDASYRRTERDGWSIMGAPFFNSSALLPAPFEDRTDSADFAMRYRSDRWFAALSWSASFYDNDNRRLRWADPYSSGVQGALARAPDNDAQTVTLSGAYRFPARTTLSLSAARGEMKQDERLLPYSIDPTLSAALPRDSLDGKIDTTHVDVRLTSRPWRFLRLKGTYRYDDRDNRSAVALWSRTITDLFTSGEPEANRPYSFERARLGVSAAVRLDYFAWLKAFEFEGGFDRIQIDRDLQEVAEQTEETGWGRVRWRPGAGAEIALRAGAARRDIDRYDTAVAAANEQNPLLRKYTLAYRYRDFLELRGTLALPDTPVTLGAEIYYASDDYTESSLGLRKHDDRRYAADVSWAVADQASVYLQGGYEDVALRVFSSATLGAADWSSQHRDRFRTLGAGCRLGGLAGRFGVNASFTYAKGSGGVDVAATLPGASAYPALKDELKRLHIDLDYRLSDALDLRLAVRYEDFASSDWALQGVEPATVPTVLTLGADPYDYDGYVTTLSVRYSFGRAPAAAAADDSQATP
jgi:MtrB/PioB family decaheme-associated outer membrane protein